jgi:hypothetical protein
MSTSTTSTISTSTVPESWSKYPTPMPTGTRL